VQVTSFSEVFMPDAPRDRRPAPAGAAVRIVLRDEHTGEPVAGAVVSLYADSSDTPGPLFATLQTDHTGYAAFKLDRSLIAAATRFRVALAGARADALTLSAADLLAGDEAHTLFADVSQLDAAAPSPGLPSVMAPDAVDLTLSPGSIGLVPHLFRGRGLCGQLMPTLMAIRRFEAFRIIADICKPRILDCGGERVQFVRGRMLEYEIAWHPAGTALGELLNSITLAPCEQVNVAVLDWMRRETAVLEQASDVHQQATQRMDHDRLVDEAMQSSVRSKNFTLASGTTSGATAAIPIKAVKLDMTAAWGAAVSTSTTTASVAATTSSQLSERIAQASSFVASQRSSVVFQTTASEHRTYQTRTIRNHNHCHTLNLMYYQVNRNYRVVTDYRGERDVILVKYENRDFDAKRAYCNAHVLKDALLDPDLRSCFDELAGALFCCDREPVGEDVRMESLTIAIDLAGGSGIIATIHPILHTTNGPMYLTQTPVGWHGNGLRTHTFTLPGQVDPKQVTSVVVFIHYVGGGMMSSGFYYAIGVEATYHAVGYSAALALASSHTPPQLLGSSVHLEAKAELPPVTQGESPCVDDSCCIQKLLGHLNCHKRYYNSLLWLNEDPNDRVMRWGCCREGDTPVSLIGQIENVPLTVYGDYVAFAVAGSKLTDDPSVPPVVKLVTMPTPGVYAEGILGQCDTCEIIDPDRRWDWKDSPCTDKAPEIGDPPAPQKGVALGDLLPDAINSLVTFSSVPAAPTSGIKDLVTALLSSADSGSTEARLLLEKLLLAITASIPGAAKPTDPKAPGK
jgi:hypothetical protein